MCRFFERSNMRGGCVRWSLAVTQRLINAGACNDFELLLRSVTLFQCNIPLSHKASRNANVHMHLYQKLFWLSFCVKY